MSPSTTNTSARSSLDGSAGPRRNHDAKARERNDAEIERWKADELPRIVREAFLREAHILFLDESGFQLTPSVCRTYSPCPCGNTPILEAWDRRDRISAISCVSLSPKQARPGLYFRLMEANRTVRGEDVVDFLKELVDSLAELKHRPDLLNAFIDGADLPLTG